MSRRERHKSTVLDGHKRRGKRFVPPLMQLSQLDTSVSYVTHMLPELVWIGLLNREVGYIRSARLLERVFGILEQIINPHTELNFALSSAFGILGAEEKARLRDGLKDAHILELLQSCIAPLNVLYSDFPLSFLGNPRNVPSEDQLVSTVRECVEETIDKYRTPGIVLNASVVLYLYSRKRLLFTQDIEIPDFNSVVDAPDSEEAQRAAGMIRSIALMVFGQQEIDRSWARHFWDRNAELSRCEFARQEIYDDQ